VAQAEIELRDLGGSGRGAFGDAKDFGAEGGGKREGSVLEKFGWDGCGQGYFDGVGGGAGH